MCHPIRLSMHYTTLLHATLAMVDSKIIGNLYENELNVQYKKRITIQVCS